ncbi:PREDICTED: tetratricopeptide repeat protein 19 homolog, mitochondrial [Habropoda laboriosa]|uniref:tetratricopeptide repeat protein 19 homolog, mitochondrial n=1 Tax=Habropoda laboriosa TaxID=597456 RepID=UPI00083DE657|nr:PREDICTED: tetratricopeptide repeat protein 19 homolog, mitochondrial [Habropoda laboriosa]
MYYQNIIINTFKHFQGFTKSSYIVTNICLLNLKKNKFITYLPQINKIKEHYRTYELKSSSQIFIISGSFLFNLFKPEKEKDEVEELTMTIKRSILLIQKEEFLKAEQMLHIALRQAQTLQHYDGITYVYDVMANLAYDLNDFKKAEKLFISVLKRLIAKGIPEDDLAVIHISIKIADIYDKIGNVEKAENGYKFCLENLQNHLAKDSENQDVLQLLGLNLEKYASMLFSRAQYTDALKYFIQAYDVSIKVNGEDSEQTVVLLNDLGSANYMLQKYDKAIEYLTKAAELGNINTYTHIIEGERLAKDGNNEESMIEAKKCLEKIKSLIS